MFLRTLELHGFKSFAQKTTVHFDPGVTAIVGPNGCGKSNVVDAVRWVLGEQRARLLRSERMDNVLFNGSASRRPLGMAEVSLTVENTRGVLPSAYAEVTITRRLYRSGESEYLLNGTECRLKDVLDLFMDTGMGAGAYSVIELKMIEDVLSPDAADRRRLFEEAAGVTKYKLRRQQALKKLEATQADLTRLADLAVEVEKQTNALERQAKKAARAQRLEQQLAGLERALAAFEQARLDAEARGLDREARHVRGEADALSARLAAGEAALEAQRTALIGREGAVSEKQQALHAHTERVRALEADGRLATERRGADTRTLERLAREADADAAREAQLAVEQEQLAVRAADADAAHERAVAAEEEATAARDAAATEADARRAPRDAARAAAAGAMRAAADARAALDRLRDRRTLREEETDRLQAERTGLLARIADAQRAAAAAQAEFQQAEAALAQADADAVRARAEADARRADLDAAEAAVRNAQLARDTAAAEVALIASLLTGGDEGESTAGAVAFLAAHPEWGEPTLVADVLGADDRDRLALDAALGSWASAIVVNEGDEAEAAIARLRVAKAGRATFLALDRLPARPGAERSPTPPGSTPALGLARAAAKKYEPLLKLLLLNVFVVEGLADARRLRERYPVARFVTREGDWTGPNGSVHGGGGETRASARRLGWHERMDGATDAVAAANAELAARERARDEARAALDAARPDEAERQLATVRAARDTASAALTRTSAAVEALLGNVGLSEARLAALEAAISTDADDTDLEATAEAEAAEASRAEAARAEAERAFEEAEDARRAADAARGEARLALADARHARETSEREGDRLRRERDALDTRRAEREADAARLRETLAGADATDADLAAQLDAERGGTDRLQSALVAAEGALLEARALVSETERALRDLRSQREAALDTQRAAELKLAELRARQDVLAERLEGEQAAGTEAPVPDDFDPDAARDEVPRLREALRTLGPVNALALEQYDEEKARLDELRTQAADLLAAETTLLDTIREINQTAAERFGETFELVRTEFQRLFRELFGDRATADLALDGSDPLEAPVEILARPRGKRPVGIAQLSGGEKTLTAIALLFAIYLVKPSPFCLLDEVDAPLDDANVERFMRLLRTFAEKTQFVLVTHNKRTMEAADRLYGITMPEVGVSRLVGVRFGDVPEPVEAAPEPAEA